LALEQHPERLHLIAGVTQASARLNILDCNGYGLLNYFSGRCREGLYQGKPCLYVQALSGEKVILVHGGGKLGDEKPIKGNSFGMAYITEVNECHPVFVKEIFDRTIASQDRKIYHDLNPKADNHWYYEDILGFHEARQADDVTYGYNYGHFTIADNMSLSDDRLREILATYDKKSVWYQRDILGLRKQAEGRIYDMFDPELHTCHDAPAANRGVRYIAIDYGTVNPMVFLDIRDTGDAVFVMREYYYDSQKELKQKTDSEYAADLQEFIGDMSGDNYPVYVIIDPSAASFKAELRNMGLRAKDADNTILDGIRMVASLFMQRRLHIHSSCINLIAELMGYVWDEAARQRGEEKPLKKADHGCDALRYFCKTIINLKRWGHG